MVKLYTKIIQIFEKFRPNFCNSTSMFQKHNWGKENFSFFPQKLKRQRAEHVRKTERFRGAIHCHINKLFKKKTPFQKLPFCTLYLTRNKSSFLGTATT